MTRAREVIKKLEPASHRMAEVMYAEVAESMGGVSDEDAQGAARPT